MKTFTKIFFYSAFIFSSFQSFGQTNSEQIDLQENVIGMIEVYGNVILITETNYLQLKTIDAFEEYYKKVYGDSNLVNPNTELKENFDINIIPFISPDLYEQNQFTFDAPVKLGLLIQFNNPSRVNLTDYGFEFLNSLLKQNQKLNE